MQKRLFKNDPDAHVLYENVRDVADPALRYAFKQQGDSDERGRYARLAQAIKAIVGEQRWQSGSNLATIKTLREAIGKLDIEMSGRSPDKPDATDGGSKYKGLPERELAEVMYGFRDDEIIRARERKPGDSEYGQKLRYETDYKPAILERMRALKQVDGRTASRALEIIWQDIAQALLDMEAAAIRKPKADYENIEVEYSVDRPTIREALKEALRWGEPLTWVWGDAGTGKTTAVDSVLTTIDEPIVRIDCRADGYDSQWLNGQLVAVLRAYKQLGEGHNADIKVQFCDFLGSPEAPTYVVIENHEAGTFREIVDRANSFNKRVIILSRFPPPSKIKNTANCVRVGELEESAELIRRYIPDAADFDCKQLAKALFSRALFLDQACKALRRRQRTIESYLKSIRSDSSLVRYIDSLPHEFNRGVGAHYRFLLEGLQDIALVLKVLDVVLYTGNSKCSIDLVKVLWANAYNDDSMSLITVMSETENPNAEIDEVSITAEQEVEGAIYELERCGIVGVADGLITCHPLTSLYIGKIRETELAKCQQDMLQAVWLSDRSLMKRWRRRIGGGASAIIPAIQDVVERQKAGRLPILDDSAK